MQARVSTRTYSIMSKKKIPSDVVLSDVKVEVPRLKKHRREADPSDVVRHKQRREADPSDVKTNVTRYKQRRDVELGNVGTHKQQREAEPSEVRVVGDRQRQRRHTHTAADAISHDDGKRIIAKVSSRSNDYVYDNKAYVGSLNNVNEARHDRIHEPPTSVYREQYWACSKWSFAKKVLAIAVGVALGAGIGLAVILVVTGKDAQEVIDGIFQSSVPD